MWSERVPERVEGGGVWLSFCSKGFNGNDCLVKKSGRFEAVGLTDLLNF